MTFSKLIVAFLLANGVAMTWASYYLAYIGRTQIAEILSKAVVVEVLGVIGMYSAKSLFENLSKNNTWPDRVKRCYEEPTAFSAEVAPEPTDDEPITKTRI